MSVKQHLVQLSDIVESSFLNTFNICWMHSKTSIKIRLCVGTTTHKTRATRLEKDETNRMTRTKQDSLEEGKTD